MWAGVSQSGMGRFSELVRYGFMPDTGLTCVGKWPGRSQNRRDIVLSSWWVRFVSLVCVRHRGWLDPCGTGRPIEETSSRRKNETTYVFHEELFGLVVGVEEVKVLEDRHAHLCLAHGVDGVDVEGRFRAYVAGGEEGVGHEAVLVVVCDLGEDGRAPGDWVGLLALLWVARQCAFSLYIMLAKRSPGSGLYHTKIYGSNETHSPIMPHTNHLLRPLRIQNPHNLPRHLLHPVLLEVIGAVRGSVSQQVRGDDAVPRGAELVDLVVPVVAGAGEAVEEEEVRLGACFGGHVHVCVFDPGGADDGGLEVLGVGYFGHCGVVLVAVSSGTTYWFGWRE